MSDFQTFLAGNQLYDWVSHGWGCCCQKKLIDIFTHKQRHFSIDMKTKIVQHVPRINISIWHKTCHMSHATCHMWHDYKYSLLSKDIKTKVVQHVPRINISILHMTCDMRNVTCYMWHVTDTVTVTVTDTNKDTQVPSFCHVDIFYKGCLSNNLVVFSLFFRTTSDGNISETVVIFSWEPVAWF